MIVKYCPSLAQGRVLNNKGTGHRMPGRLGSESSVSSELPQLAHNGAGLLTSLGGGRNRGAENELGLSLANMMLPPFLSDLTEKHDCGLAAPVATLSCCTYRAGYGTGGWGLIATLTTLLPACPRLSLLP